MTREQRLGYERRILAAEVETVRLARRAKRFADMIERNTKTLDAALCVANFDADKRGYDRLVVEPWMPALSSILDDIAQILPDDDNDVTGELTDLAGNITDPRRKSAGPLQRAVVAAWLRGEEAEEEATAVLFAIPNIADETFGEMARKVCKQLAYMVEYRANFASVDGRRMAETENTGSVPQGTTSAVAKPDAQGSAP